MEKLLVKNEIFGTYPVVLHFNGGCINRSKYIGRKIFNKNGEWHDFKCPDGVEVVSLKTRDSRDGGTLREDKNRGLKVTFIGGNSSFVQDGGYFLKIKALKHYLEHGCRSDIVLFLDESDTFFNWDLEKYIVGNKFTLEEKIIFGVEKNYWIGNERYRKIFSEREIEEVRKFYYDKYEYSSHSNILRDGFKYLNSGCILGRRKLLIDGLNKCLEYVETNIKPFVSQSFLFDDQGVWSFVLAKYDVPHKLDYTCELCQNFSGIKSNSNIVSLEVAHG